MDEKIVAGIFQPRALPRHVDDRVDHEIRHVNAFRPELSGERLGKDALSCFESTNEALAYVETGRFRGKVVIKLI